MHNSKKIFPKFLKRCYNTKIRNLVIKMNKEQILNRVNILLISDNEADYNAVVNYGFKKITHFKSIINADAYFKAHPDDLDKFDLVIKGRQKVQQVCFEGNTELDNKINNMPHEIANIYIFDYADEKDYRYYCNNARTETHDMSSVLNFYVRQLLADKELQEKLNNADPLAPLTMPLITYPQSKKDLKVLLLLSGIVYTNDEDAIKEKLDVDIQLEEDNNYGLGRNVIRKMGDYDIIIASKVYSNNLIYMNEEHIEQGQLKGKGLGLVAIYDDDSIFTMMSDGDYTFNYIGTELIVRSAIGNINRESQEVKEEHYKVKTDSRAKLAISIVEKAIINYHQALKEINGRGLEDVKPEEFSKYEEEYIQANEQYEQGKKEYARQVQIYDDILRAAQKYLSNKKRGRTKNTPADIKITESANGITIENYIKARKICSLTISLNDENKNRVFIIQTAKDNGLLTSPCEVAIYPIEKSYNVNRPNENQIRALNGVWKKIERDIVPINASCAQSLKLAKQSRRKNRHNKN